VEVGEPDRSDPETTLAQTGAALWAALVVAVPGWIEREVDRMVDAWDLTRPPGPGTDHDEDDDRRRDTVRGESRVAGRRAAADAAARLGALLSADSDAQWTTPLEVVRGLVEYATTVLRRAGVPPVVRDRFDESRFPDDLYGLTPTSLAAVDPRLAPTALAWGAAKAQAHRARHR
jgi:hypothetical protein